MFIFLFSFAVKTGLAQELTLKEAVKLALRYNRSVLYIAHNDLTRAAHQYAVSRTQYNPKLSFDVKATRNYSRSGVFTSQSDIKAYISQASNIVTPSMRLSRSFLTPFGSRSELALSWEAEMFGSDNIVYRQVPTLFIQIQQPLGKAGISSGHREQIIAGENFKLAELNYQSRREELIMQVLDGYFLLMTHDQAVKQAESALASAKRRLLLGQLRLKSGTIAEFEVLNAELQVRIAKDQLLVVKNNANHQRVRFRQLLGIDSSRELNLPTEEIPLLFPDFELGTAIEQAQKNRIDMQQALIGLEISKFNILAAQSGKEARLSLNGSLSLSSGDRNTWQETFGKFPNRGWYLNAAISFPILDGGMASNQEHIASLVELNSINTLELLRKTVEIEITKLYEDIRLQRRRKQTLMLNMEIARETLRIAELKFEKGMLSGNEVGSIYERYYIAQKALSDARITYNRANIKLMKEIGYLSKWVLEDELFENDVSAERLQVK